MNSDESTSMKLKVSRVVRAKRERVFEAWIKPEFMQKWFCPQNLIVDEVKAAARVGGKYRIAMKDVERGKIFTTSGIYHEIIPNQKLVFSWSFDAPDQTNSLVTVTFEDQSGGTKITVLHERYSDMKGEDTHLQGWTSALENLEKQLFSK